MEMTTREKGNGTLFWQNDTLDPLEDSLRKGLIAVTVVSMVSFFSAASLFAYLSYKAIADIRRGRRRQRHMCGRPGEAIRSEVSLDLSFSMPVQRHTESGPDARVARSESTRSTNTIANDHGRQHAEDTNQTRTTTATGGGCQSYRNPFPFLIMSILGAECTTTLGFSLNLSWVLRNGIVVGTSTCTAQGFFNSLGILVSSFSFMFMATCNYLAIVWGFRPQNKNIFLCNLWAWIFCTALCWVNPKYPRERLWSCWAWVLFSIPYTCLLYTLIFWKIYRQKSRRPNPGSGSLAGDNVGNLPSGYHPAFFVYPFVYVVCTIPLAVVRLSQSLRGSGSGKSHATDSDAYYCFAAVMMASNGLWNTILWLTTIFISTPEDMQHAGLGTFAFMRTPEWRKFGNMVWISGPMSKGVHHLGKGHGRHQGNNNNSSNEAPSQEFLRLDDNGIQMNVVTTITVEETLDREEDVKQNGRLPIQEKHEHADSSMPTSVCSSITKQRRT
ncbi:hypothetical protein PG999_010937 [Apiospora kogelbergensis]|uniref:G-protein coupled receptors family 1 profile domain-containing protein n=1 Tax=Apiospora kogelbergensis TaxID=1337665 RepID=A0AAW0QBK7_9PEZI